MKEQIDPTKDFGCDKTITDRNEFFTIPPQQAKQIKSLRVENQTIDNKISVNYNDIFHPDLEILYFYNCSFVEDGEGILRECPGVKKVGFINCNLSYDTLESLLISNDPYNNIDVLDLTGNKLGKDPKRFARILFKTIALFKTINELILTDNGFDETIISLIKEEAGNCIEKIIL